MFKRYLVIPLALILALGVIGVARSQPAPAGVFKIGLFAPLSGASAQAGVQQQRGAEMAADEINAKGGITVAGKKYNIRIITVDDKYTAEGGVAAANQLVYADGVKFVIGPFGSAIANATVPTVLTPNKIVHFTVAWAPILKKENPYTFRIGGEPQTVWPGILSYIKDNYPQFTKLASNEPNDATGQSDIVITDRVAKELGFTVVGHELYDRRTTDYYPIISRQLANGSQIWTNCGSAGDIGLNIKQAYERGFKGLMVGWGTDILQMRDIAGNEAMEKMFIGYFSLNYESPTGVLPGPKALANKYWAKYGKTGVQMTEYVEHAYDAVNVIAARVQAVNSIDNTDAFIKDIETFQLPLLQGPSLLGGQKLYGIKRAFGYKYGIGRIINGQWVTVDSRGPVPVP